MTIPEPQIISWEVDNINKKNQRSSWSDILNLIDQINQIQHSRLVLDINHPNIPSSEGNGKPWNLINWAKHSVSSWGGATINKDGYIPIYQFPQNKLTNYHQQQHEGIKWNIIKLNEQFRVIDKHINLCKQFLIAPNGNRSCFNKCN